MWVRSPALAAALKEAIPNHDVVHIHSLYLYHSWVAASLARKFKIPYIIRPHGTLDPYLYKRHRMRKSIMDLLFQNKALRNASAIHYTTREELHLAEPYTFGAPGAVVPNGVNAADYDELPPAGALRARYPELAQGRIILFLGRLNFKKGLDILIPAFAKALDADDSLRLVIVGPDGGEEQKTRGWVREFGVEDKTVLTGMLTDDDILAAYKDAEVFVLPSYSENFGIAVVEAMASGVPVLISDKVNIWREVVDGGAGRVAPAEIDAFASLMIDAMADRDGLDDMAAKAKQVARDKFDWQSVAAQFEDLYRSVSA